MCELVSECGLQCQFSVSLKKLCDKHNSKSNVSLFKCLNVSINVYRPVSD